MVNVTKTLLLAVAATMLFGIMLGGCGSAQPGGEQSVGALKVTLLTDPNPPVAGSTGLTVTVSKEGKAITDARVKVETSMPDMNMPGPSLDLQPSASGYTGSLNLMAGKWQVKVNVISGSDKGTATYSFDVK